MPEIMTGIMSGSALLGAKQSMDAADRAEDAQDFQQNVQMRQLAMEEEKFDIYKEHFLPTEQAYSEAERAVAPEYEEARRTQLEAVPEDREFYEEHVRPVEQRMMEEARPDYDYVTAKAAADTDQAQDRAMGMTRRSLESMGVDPSSGAWQKAMARNFSGQRAANIGAARERERGSAFDKMAVATGRGAGLRTGSAGTPNMTRSGINLDPNLSPVSQGAGNLANQSWRMAKDYASAAGSAAESAAIGFDNWQNQGSTSMPSKFSWSSSGRKHYARGGLVRPGPRDYGDRDAPKRYANGGLVRSNGYAGGGVVRGPGDGTSDSVPGQLMGPHGKLEQVMVSNGEYVVDAETVEQIVRDWLGKRKSGISRSMMS